MLRPEDIVRAIRMKNAVKNAGYVVRDDNDSYVINVVKHKDGMFTVTKAEIDADQSVHRPRIEDDVLNESLGRRVERV